MADLAASDWPTFLSDFGTDVEPTTWGGDTFRGILDRVEVDAPGGNVTTSRWRVILTTAAANVPDGAATGDQVTVDGTAYKVVDFRFDEPGQVVLVLARVS